MEAIRLQKFFSECGVMSRRAAEAEILAGRVTVNGKPAQLGMRIDPETDTVLYRGRRLALPAASGGHTYIMLNKPAGYVTTMRDEQGRPTAASLLHGVRGRVYPIGRLDMYSEGLLLFTDDGDLTNLMTHPSHDVPKKYLVTIRGTLTAADAARFTQPMTLDGYALRPVEARLTDARTAMPGEVAASTLEITLHEGRNRQIRRMCEQLGFTVLRLRRISVGTLTLGDLAPGRWRTLTPDEIDYLHSIKTNTPEA